MKTALKIGFSTTTQHWKSTLMQGKFLIFTFILLTLLESFLLHEVTHLLSWLGISSSYSISIISVDVLDISDNSNSLADYLLTLSRSFFYEFLILNSFFLGVYYHHTGFPEQGKLSSKLDNVLDVPMEENRRPTLGLVLQYVEKGIRSYYFKIILLFIVAQFFGSIVGSFLYRISTFVGQVYYLLFGQLTNFLLLLLYLKWLDLPFSKVWENKDKWLFIVICGLLLPNVGWYIWTIISSMVNMTNYVFSSFVEMRLLLLFLGGIAYYMLLVPFVSIFYSQTLIYFKHEQEA